MSSTTVLPGRQVTLRGLEPRDQEQRRRLGMHPEIARCYGKQVAAAGELPAEGAERWYSARVEEANPHWWVIEFDGVMIGTAALNALSEQDRKARYAVGLMAPEFLGRGFGREATLLVLGYAFDTLALHRVDLRVLAFNTRAILAYRACGFVEEGRERDSCRLDNAWHDDVMMGILEPEYRAISQP